MRDPAHPMTAAQFTALLTDARAGRTRTDTGADDATADALEQIAVLGDTPERTATARAAFKALTK